MTGKGVWHRLFCNAKEKSWAATGHYHLLQIRQLQMAHGKHWQTSFPNKKKKQTTLNNFPMQNISCFFYFLTLTSQNTTFLYSNFIVFKDFPFYWPANLLDIFILDFAQAKTPHFAMLAAGCDGLTSVLFPADPRPVFFVGGEARLVSMKHLISKEVGWNLPKKQNGTSNS